MHSFARLVRLARLPHVLRFTLALAVLLVGSAVLAACSSKSSANSGSGTTVAVTLDSFHVKADRSSVPAGTVTFNVTNAEAVGHEMVIIKTNTPDDKLAVNSADGTADETGKVDEVDVFQGPKTTKSLTLNLAAGKYVLICNQPGHYQSGMRMAFTVG